MNILEYYPVWVSLFVFIFCYYITSKIIKIFTDSFKGFIVTISLCSCFWWYSFDLTITQEQTEGYKTTKTLVSTSPFESYLQGSFSLFMGTGSGELETKRWYLLREQIREGLYKDFTVKEEVYIEERESLPKDKGLFEQYFSCQTNTASYRMFVWEIDKTKEECKFNKQTIAVPKGFVIKELRI